MKKFICTSILAVLIASVTALRAQNNPEEYLGLPGDNLNLYAVMDLFQKSETLEAFERDLNAEDSRINNLDLNGDNMIDYITVTDYPDGDVHTIVLRAALNRNENQDVAVFTVEKFRNGSVQIQLIGDEDLYGRNYIVEPIYAETPNPGYRGRTVYRDNVTVVTTTYYEVAAWPVIRFMYNPYYISWHSSWYWDYYPVYWHPWRPYYWHYYYGYHYNWYPHYYSHYRHWDNYRYARYEDHYYHNIRQHSPNVSHRISEGNYRQTYSRPEQRRDGEAMYTRTQGSRNSDTRSSSSAPASDKRNSPAVTGRSANSRVAGQNPGEARRSDSRSSSAQSAPSPTSRQSTVQRSQAPASRQQSSVQRSQPSASRQQSSVQRSQPSASRQQSSVQRSQPSASRQQSSVQRSQPSASRQQSSVQRSQPSASRQQSSVKRSQPSRSSGPSASSSRSGRSGRSAGSVSQKSSSGSSQKSSSSSQKSSSSSQKSSSSSHGSDNGRSSRR